MRDDETAVEHGSPLNKKSTSSAEVIHKQELSPPAFRSKGDSGVEAAQKLLPTYTATTDTLLEIAISPVRQE